MSRFLDAAGRKPVDATPVWLMRQAGRSLPEYRKLRERWTLQDIVAQPELCAEVTLQPVRSLGVDAAVMFADIMLPVGGMGVEFELVENMGPVIAHPIARPEDVARLRVPEGDEAAPQVIDAVRRVVEESPVPVICFSGAPFTLASYLIEGRPSRTFAKAKAFMYTQPRAFDLLLDKLARTMSRYLEAQVGAGAQAVQLFDSWVGALTRDDYEARVARHTRAIFDALAPRGVPLIHFGTDTSHLLESIEQTGPDIVSLDWRIPLDEGWNRVGHGRGIQGNLDPAVLLGPADLVRERTRDVLRRAAGRRGHIFNLGHGVLPESSVENLQILVETVHSWIPANVA